MAVVVGKQSILMRAASVTTASLLAMAIVIVGASAQSAAVKPTPANPAAAKPTDKLLVEADQLVFDKDKNTVSAVGNVQLYYQKRSLQADRVTYDRGAKRVYAEGHAKLVDERGDVIYGKQIDLTDDFRDGFIEGAEIYNADKTRFVSPRVERIGGTSLILNDAIYTACEACKNDPERAPIWRVRGAKITEDQQTHTVYYEGAWMELFGWPVAYLPYFSAPDPTVTRASGLLAPQFVSDSVLGFGVGQGYFFNLAPNYDVTITPTYFTKEGLLTDVEWRHRLENGSYSVRAIGIEQMNPGLFAAKPYDAGERRARGMVSSTGEFLINPFWKFGWDVTLQSDRFFINDYKIRTPDLSQYYFQDVVSSVYLRGQGNRSYFDLTGYRIVGTTANDEQKQLPNAVPSFDYDRTFALDPEKTHGIGGEVKVTLNAVNVTRTEAAFQATGRQTLDSAYGLFNVCENQSVTPSPTNPNQTHAATYAPGSCLLRGIAGAYTRATAQVSWQDKFIDPLGEVWKPFVFARVTGESASLNTTGMFSYSNGAVGSTVSNSSQPAFFSGVSAQTSALAMPGFGLEYRYPFESQSWFGRQVIEPIAQIIVRPNEVLPKLQPNEDAQSLVFDDTTLFAWDKYSGYDRSEGGTRFNYGAQYVADFANGGRANVVFGQSIQVAGTNSFAMADAANTGLNSGLDKKYSDFVARETVSPWSWLTLTTKEQFDSVTFGLNRFDAIANFSFHDLTVGFDYGHYNAQPMLGWNYTRQGLMANASYKFLDHWNVNSNFVLDLSRHYYDVAGGSTTPKLLVTNYGLGFGYSDECTTLNVKYLSSLSDPIGSAPAIRDQTVVVELVLRTLGEVRGSTSVGQY